MRPWRGPGPSFRRSAFVGPTVLLALLVLLATAPARASPPQPTFVGIGAIASATGGDLTVGLPTGILANDLMLLECFMRTGSAETVTVSGWTAVTGSPYDRGTVRYWLWYRVAVSASETAPLFDTDGATGEDYCLIGAYRGADIAAPFGVVGTPQTGTASPASLTGVTTPGAQNLLVLPLGIEEDGGCPITVTATDPAALVEHTATTTTGADACITFSEEARITAGATGNIGVTFTGSPVGWGAIPVSLKPPAPPVNGFSSLISVTTASESPGANCAAGGTKVTLNWGLDNGDGGGTARDGVLQAGEIDGTVIYYSCTGAKGDTGATGPKGDTGATGAAGFNSLVKVSTITGACTSGSFTGANGGLQIQWGLDNGDGGGIARDGVLQFGEIDGANAVCNGNDGAQGPPGNNGTNGTNGTNGAPGSNGTNGANGTGSLVNVTYEPPGPNCAAGGLNITAGQDANHDNVLQWAEVSVGPTFACNGPAGAPGGDGPQGPQGPPGPAGAGAGWDIWLALGLLAFIVLALLGLWRGIPLLLLFSMIAGIGTALRSYALGMGDLILALGLVASFIVGIVGAVAARPVES